MPAQKYTHGMSLSLSRTPGLYLREASCGLGRHVLPAVLRWRRRCGDCHSLVYVLHQDVAEFRAVGGLVEAFEERRDVGLAD